MFSDEIDWGERWAERQKLWTTFSSLGESFDPEPDSQSPSSIRKNGLFYGASKFSRDPDLIVLLSPVDLNSLEAALEELQAVGASKSRTASAGLGYCESCRANH